MSDPAGTREAHAAGVRHGRQKHRGWLRGVLSLLGISVCVALVAGTSLAAIAFWNVGHRITDGAVDIGGSSKAVTPSIGAYPGAFNILVVGVDNDPTQSASTYGKRDGTLNDVNILLHVAADHKSATAVSIPRDMIVPIPACTSEDGKHTSSPASGLPINNAYYLGGLKCVVDTVEKLSGLEIPFAGVVTFDGVVKMSNVVGGVDICVNKAINDPKSGLDIPAGHSTIQGAQAAAFVRSRHGVGDGSDLGRISSQQVFLSALVRKLKSDGTLGDVSKLLGIANTAATAMKLSTSLASPTTMVSVARALKDIPLENVVFVQYPSADGTGAYKNKVQPVTGVASKMWSAIKADKTLVLDSSSVGANGGSELDPSNPASAPATTAPAAGGATGTATPPAGSGSGGTGSDDSDSSAEISGLKGQTAAQQTCAKAYSG